MQMLTWSTPACLRTFSRSSADRLEQQGTNVPVLHVDMLIRTDVYIQGMLLLGPASQPVQHLGEGALVEDGRRQLDGQRTGCRERLIQKVVHMPQPVADLRFGCLAVQDIEVELGAHQQLLEMVMKDRRQPLALLLLGLGQFARQTLQLVCPMLSPRPSFRPRGVRGSRSTPEVVARPRFKRLISRLIPTHEITTPRSFLTGTPLARTSCHCPSTPWKRCSMSHVPLVATHCLQASMVRLASSG